MEKAGGNWLRITRSDSYLSTRQKTLEGLGSLLKNFPHQEKRNCFSATFFFLEVASMRCFSFQTHLCSCQGSSLNSFGVQHFLALPSAKNRKGWSQTLTTKTYSLWSLVSANTRDHSLSRSHSHLDFSWHAQRFIITLDGG
jgi:hypothetical protein